LFNALSKRNDPQMLIEVRDLKIAFGTEILLDGVSFTVNQGDRIGLIGNNGTGKTTLLRILMGLQEHDAGTVTRRSSLRISYVQQELPEHHHGMRLRDFVREGLNEEERAYSSYRVDIALDELRFPEELRERPLHELSGGWRRLAMIARVSLQDPDLLLLDEPSNHLDLESLMILEKWLTDQVGCPYVLSSHDREFLDRCTKSSIVLTGRRAEVIGSPFSAAMADVEARRAAAERRRQVEEKEVARLEASAKRLAVWGKVFDNPDLARRAKAIESRIRQMREEMTRVEAVPRRALKLSESAQRARRVLDIAPHRLSKPDGSPLLRIAGLTVIKGEKVLLLGLNGSGKSTLLRAVAAGFSASGSVGQDTPYVFNPQVNLVFLDQDLGILSEDETTYAFIERRTSLMRTELTRRLVQAGFDSRLQARRIRDLSYGQRARLAFLMLDLLEPNFYVLDEPTNHLDIEGRERLEAELMKPGVSCLMTTHDRRMLRTVGTRFLMIEKGQLKLIDSSAAFFEKVNEAIDAG
jgi:ATPase subunit of ABC transporter with duplicated ATPase domains